MVYLSYQREGQTIGDNSGRLYFLLAYPYTLPTVEKGRVSYEFFLVGHYRIFHFFLPVYILCLLDLVVNKRGKPWLLLTNGFPRSYLLVPLRLSCCTSY